MQAHTKLKAIALDQSRNWIYSIGEDDHTIIVFDLAKGKPIASTTFSNATINCIAIDMYAKRLFCATRQGMLLFCDIQSE